MEAKILWVDDVRTPPSANAVWVKSVNEAKAAIQEAEQAHNPFMLLDLDHDAGNYAKDGGDYIRLLDWLEASDRQYAIRVHSMNPVGRENMLRIAYHNGWDVVR